MAQIKICVNKTAPRVDELHSLERNLRSYSDRVQSALNILRSNQSAAMGPILGELRTVNADILNEAAKMDTLAGALQHIVSAYSDCERRNLNSLAASPVHIRDGGGSGGGEADSSFKNIFERFLDWIKRIFGWEDPAGDPVPVSRQQEQEHDLYMQSEIFSLMDTPAYSKETWSGATVEQRKQILTNYLADLSRIYGVSVSSEISFYQGNETSRGSYQHSSKLISINENYLSRTDSYQIMQTVVHEMRHAYQHAAVDDPDSYQVSAETIQQWKENFKPGNYKTTSKGYSYTEYVSQPVEYDAKNFAKQYSDLVNANPEYAGSW